MGVPPAGRRCSDEVALLCFEEQCNDIVKASGTSLGDPFPHTATSLPQAGPPDLHALPSPLPSELPSPWKLEILARPGPLGSEGTLPPGRGPAPVGLHSGSQIQADHRERRWQACLTLFPCCTTVRPWQAVQ